MKRRSLLSTGSGRTRPLRRLGTALLLSACVVLPARADTELWTNLETRIPVSRPDDPWPDAIRCIAGTRYGFRYPGLGLANIRAGALWDLAPWLMVGLQTSTYALQEPPEQFRQEFRLELEPNLRWHLGALALNDRNRLEYRWRPTTVSWRYRNQLRLTWQRPDKAVWPTVWNEVNLDLGNGTLMQNRTAAGLIFRVNDSTRVTLEYLFRTRYTPSDWAADHVLNLNLFFAPHADDVLGADDSGP